MKRHLVIWATLGILALATLIVFSEDIEKRAIRYRNNSSLSFDGTVTFKDEDGNWTFTPDQLHKAIVGGNALSGPLSFATSGPITLTFDLSKGNYQFITTNNAVPISGFTGYTAGQVNWAVLSFSNSAATSQTFSWPASCLLYGTNSGTSISVPSAHVLKATISIDPHGTNLCATVSN